MDRVFMQYRAFQEDPPVHVIHTGTLSHSRKSTKHFVFDIVLDSKPRIGCLVCMSMTEPES